VRDSMPSRRFFDSWHEEDSRCESTAPSQSRGQGGSTDTHPLSPSGLASMDRGASKRFPAVTEFDPLVVDSQ